MSEKSPRKFLLHQLSSELAPSKNLTIDKMRQKENRQHHSKAFIDRNSHFEKKNRRIPERQLAKSIYFARPDICELTRAHSTSFKYKLSRHMPFGKVKQQ